MYKSKNISINKGAATKPKVIGTGDAGKVNGDPVYGNTLTLTVASNFTVISIQWARELNGVRTNISGATGYTYTTTNQDIGYKVYPVLTGYYNSNASNIEDVPVAPTVVTAPSLLTAYVGSAVTYTDGVFSGAPAPVVTNEWYVNGAFVGSITPIASIVGSQVLLKQRATNSEGTVFSDSNVLAVSDPNPEDAIFNSAIVVPFADFLLEGESLITDGTADYGAQIQTAMEQLNAEFVLDGNMRQLYFPAGEFRLSATTPNLYGVTGVGIKGAGSALTKFIPIRSFIRTNPDYDSNTWHESQLWSGFEVDCSEQVIEDGFAWYAYKAFFMARCRLQYYKDIVAHDSQGTLFGLDFMDRCYFYDCVAYGSGRYTSAGSGPGAGFGISVGHNDVEVCEFHRCVSYNNKTGSFYFEAVAGATTKPTGILIKDCISYGSYIGVDDCGCGSILIQGGEHHDNALAGVKWGANGVSSYAKGPINGRIIGAKLYGNGTADTTYASSGGVVFTYAVDTSSSTFHITDTEITNNVTNGIANNFKTSVAATGSLPPNLVIDGTSKLEGNGASGLYFYHPTQEIESLVIASTVSVKNNGTSNACDMADGITLCCNNSGVNIACSGGDDLETHRQQSVVAFRGKQFSANDPIISGDFSAHATISPIRMEHTVVGTFTNTSTLNTERPLSVLVTNRHKDPVAAGSFTPTVTSGTIVESTSSDAPDVTTSWVATASSTSTLSVDFYNNLSRTDLAVGDLYCISAWIKASVAGKTVNSAANNSQSAIGVSLVPALITDGEWQRVAFFGRLKSTTFTMSLRMLSPTAGDTLEITELMFTKGHNIYDYFDGTVNGGTWTGTANASTSTKTIAA